MELLQSTLPYRHASWRDILANSVGAAAAVGVWRLPLDVRKGGRVTDTGDRYR